METNLSLSLSLLDSRYRNREFVYPNESSMMDERNENASDRLGTNN